MYSICCRRIEYENLWTQPQTLFQVSKAGETPEEQLGNLKTGQFTLKDCFHPLSQISSLWQRAAHTWRVECGQHTEQLVGNNWKFWRLTILQTHKNILRILCQNKDDDRLLLLLKQCNLWWKKKKQSTDFGWDHGWGGMVNTDCRAYRGKLKLNKCKTKLTTGKAVVTLGLPRLWRSQPPMSVVNI